MAGYFSNHSQSRLLANRDISSNSQNNTPSPSPVRTAPPSASRRQPSSKHFATSLTTSGDDKLHSKEKSLSSASSLSPGVHPLRNTWVFWFRQQRAPGNKITNYEEGIKKISSFSSVESFWSLWTHLQSPSALLPTTDYLLFHLGVRRPVWEDPLNITGGKWIIRLRKGIADRIWEDLVVAIIGDQFDECKLDGGKDESILHSAVDSSIGNGGDNVEWPEICGCTISVRQSEDIISIWNRVDGDHKVREKIRDTIRTVLNLPPSTIMEYKSNNDSMQDKSSFRNSAIDRTPLS
ncbi:hypothetical protein SERLA73DRAFT_191402 [Serpula lacrymans var. lacrymans S7.3]|uniref:Translation initiation factor eIF4e n=1 Tax=Serpula lacrymans var. lacrymans (strain S7.3) TaxID=936435 RepID=F8QHG8_SERL3|nr:hypothetical protein SERLA73DRAFT_191402 [Serpula lacrymans var. lacrymans S7.3]